MHAATAKALVKSVNIKELEQAKKDLAEAINIIDNNIRESALSKRTYVRVNPSMFSKTGTMFRKTSIAINDPLKELLMDHYKNCGFKVEAFTYQPFGEPYYFSIDWYE
jgi:hypothetical protein